MKWLSKKIRFQYFRLRADMRFWKYDVRQMLLCLFSEKHPVLKMTLLFARLMAAFIFGTLAFLMVDGMTPLKMAFFANLMSAVCIVSGMIFIFEIHLLRTKRDLRVSLKPKTIVVIAVVNFVISLIRFIDFSDFIQYGALVFSCVLALYFLIMGVFFVSMLWIVSEAPWSMLAIGLLMKDHRAVEHSIEYLGDVNRNSARHYFPLVQAINYSRYDEIGYLLGKGADPLLMTNARISILEWSKIIDEDAYTYMNSKMIAKEESVVLESTIDVDVSEQSVWIEF